MVSELETQLYARVIEIRTAAAAAAKPLTPPKGPFSPKQLHLIAGAITELKEGRLRGAMSVMTAYEGDRALASTFLKPEILGAITTAAMRHGVKRAFTEVIESFDDGPFRRELLGVVDALIPFKGDELRDHGFYDNAIYETRYASTLELRHDLHALAVEAKAQAMVNGDYIMPSAPASAPDEFAQLMTFNGFSGATLS